jgi:hypothetical protein
VTVSPYGLEARHTFTSWRVPWSGVRSFAVDTGPFGLTVLLSDGSTRSAWVGSRRNGERDFATVAAGAQRSERDRARAQLSPNRPVLLFLLGGMALVTALAVADAGRVERRPRAGVPRHTLQELRDLDSQIAVGDGFAHVLAPLVVVAGLGALVRVVAPRRPRQGKSDPVGVGRPAATLPPPRLPLGTSGPFDNPPVAIWGVVFCRDDGVFTTHGTLVHAISHRKVAVTEIDMYTYWSVRGIAEFSVQVQPPHRRTVATIERTPAGWKCQVYADLPMTTQRLLYVAARWAEQRYRSEPRRRRRGHRRARSTDDLEASIHDDE